jgi:DNA-binding response OmpR family regulator
MENPKIVIIEKPRRGSVALSVSLIKRGYSVVSASGVGEAERFIKADHPDLLILDAASLLTSGSRMVKRLSTTLNGAPLIVITTGDFHLHLNGISAEVLVQPFTIRKLANRIKSLLPGHADDYLQAGPIKLNTITRRVQCNGRESSLSPRCLEVLCLLIDKSGKAIKRKTIMKRVWCTDYMGDTRTLDVHISWIRKAIEEDPSNPKLLKTIRGVGFRLDL